MAQLPRLRVKDGNIWATLPSQQEVELAPGQTDFDAVLELRIREEEDFIALFMMRRWFRANGYTLHDLRTASVRQAYLAATYTLPVPS